MVLDGGSDENDRANIEILLTIVIKDLESSTSIDHNKSKKAFVIGNTRVYFRAGALEYFDAKRLCGMGIWATQIQRIIRGFHQICRYQRQRQSATLIESQMRCHAQRRHFHHTRLCSIVIQCWYRKMVAVYFLHQRKTQHRAAVMIQHCARESIQRQKYRKLQQEKRDKENLALQMEKMQRVIKEKEQRDQEQMEIEKRALLEATRKRIEEEQKRMLEEERLKVTMMQNMLAGAERKAAEKLERERKIIRQSLEDESRIAIEAERKKVENERHLFEEEKNKMEFELRRLRTENKLLEIKKDEAEQQAATEMGRRKMESEKIVALLEAQKTIEEEHERLLGEERQKVTMMQKMIAEVKEQALKEVEHERKVARQTMDKEMRTALQSERTQVEDESNAKFEDERYKMEQAMRRLKGENEILKSEVRKAKEDVMIMLSLPAPEPEIRIVEVVKYVEKEVKPDNCIISDEQKALMEESGKIIEFLRNENVKLKKKTEQQKEDFVALKQNNERLMEANASASQSFHLLNQHAKHLNNTNQKLSKTVAQYRHKIGELHVEIKNRETYYREIALESGMETETRLFYEQVSEYILSRTIELARILLRFCSWSFHLLQAMLDIVDVVSTKHCDQAIHSLVMSKAMECAKMSANVAGNTIPEMDDTDSSLVEL